VLALYCSSLIGGAARAFSQPSMYAIVPKLMPRERLSKASAWMSSAMQVASVLGPAIGGLLYGLVGLTVPAAMACVFLLAALGAIGLIRTPVPAPQLKLGAKVSEELLVGARFVFGHPLLLPALSLDMFSVLFGGVTALLPIFASDILHVGATGLGVLRASPALGAGFVSLVLTRLDVRKAAGSWLFTSVTGFGLCIVAFGLSHSFALSLLVLALSGGFDSISMVVRGTAVQLASPDAMRGRISAVNSIFIGSSNELGEFESGVAAKLLGSVPAVLVGGVVCLATVAVVYATSPVLRKLNLHELEQGS
jgi:MFS family permease